MPFELAKSAGISRRIGAALLLAGFFVGLPAIGAVFQDDDKKDSAEQEVVIKREVLKLTDPRSYKASMHLEAARTLDLTAPVDEIPQVALIAENLVVNDRAVVRVGRTQLQTATRPWMEQAHVGGDGRPVEQLHPGHVVGAGAGQCLRGGIAGVGADHSYRGETGLDLCAGA